MTDVIHFEMDPESNWDICPVCLEHLSNQDEFPGRDHMRAHHEDHKARTRARA